MHDADIDISLYIRYNPKQTYVLTKEQLEDIRDNGGFLVVNYNLVGLKRRFGKILVENGYIRREGIVPPTYDNPNYTPPTPQEEEKPGVFERMKSIFGGWKD